MINVFKNETSNVSKTVKLSLDKDTRNDKSSLRTVIMSGVFGGATVTILISANGTDFVPLTDNTFTVPLGKSETLADELWLKATVTGSTGSTNIDTYIA